MEIEHITVLRNPSEPDWTLSKFQFDGKDKGVGVEDEKREIKKKGETRIPNNTYILDLRVSPKFSSSYFRDDDGNLIHATERITLAQKEKYHTAHEMIWVTNVPNFDYILWHWGCTDDDTGGCYCVGSIFGKIGKQKSVLRSRKKYVEIYPVIWRSIKSAKKQQKNLLITYKEVDNGQK